MTRARTRPQVIRLAPEDHVCESSAASGEAALPVDDVRRPRVCAVMMMMCSAQMLKYTPF